MLIGQHRQGEILGDGSGDYDDIVARTESG
jgi:hypothetical protein